VKTDISLFTIFARKYIAFPVTDRSSIIALKRQTSWQHMQ